MLNDSDEEEYFSVIPNLRKTIFNYLVVVQSLIHVWLFEIPMYNSTPGFPICHFLLEFVQIHHHWVSDAIQPSYPLLSPSPPALSLSQHQDLFQWIGSLYQVVKVLEF